MRLFERALRRAGLPLAYSAGFNPRVQVSFPLALPLGYQSGEEVLETELVRWISPRRAEELVREQLPEGIGVLRAVSVPFADKASVTSTEFALEFSEVPADFAERLDSFMEKKEAFVQRPTKSHTRNVDVRKFVIGACLEDRTLRVELSVSPGGTARPTEVLSAVMGGEVEDLPQTRVRRTRIKLAAPPH